jgi:nicotinamidase-related amidase
VVFFPDRIRVCDDAFASALPESSSRCLIVARLFVPKPHQGTKLLLDADDCQLVLVDYQSRLMPVMQDTALVLENAQRLAQFAAAFRVPLFGTEQAPDKLGENPAGLRALCQETLAKQHFSACASGLVALLRPPARMRPVPAQGQNQNQNQSQGGNARSLPKHLQKIPPAPPVPERNTIILAGCEAHVCLLQTALELLDDEFEVWVVTDACSSRTERNRDAAFDRLASNGVELVTTEMVAYEWLRTSRHEHFRKMQALIR